jgi:hypothetical protein
MRFWCDVIPCTAENHRIGILFLTFYFLRFISPLAAIGLIGCRVHPGFLDRSLKINGIRTYTNSVTRLYNFY